MGKENGPLPRGQRGSSDEDYLRKGLWRRSFLIVDVGEAP